MAQSADGRPDRDRRGRFALGNSGGPGRAKAAHPKPRKKKQVLHILLPDDVLDVFCRDALARELSINGAAKRVLVAYARRNTGCPKKSEPPAAAG